MKFSRETIPLVQVCFRFELSFTVSKLLSKIRVNPWNFDKSFAVFGVFLREIASEAFWNYRIIQTTSEYTIPENLVRIDRLVSENEVKHEVKRYARVPTIKTGLFIKNCNDQRSQMKNSKNLIVIFHSISNESCKPLNFNCEIKHNLNVRVCSIDAEELLRWCEGVTL